MDVLVFLVKLPHCLEYLGSSSNPPKKIFSQIGHVFVIIVQIDDSDDYGGDGVQREAADSAWRATVVGGGVMAS